MSGQVLARRRLRPARGIRHFDRAGCRTAGVQPPRLWRDRGFDEGRMPWRDQHPAVAFSLGRACSSVADLERDFDKTTGCFPDQPLSFQHALSDYELQRRHPRGLLEHARKGSVFTPAVSEPTLIWTTSGEVEVEERENKGPRIKSLIKKRSFFLRSSRST
jgi:hypothetical protein